MSRRKGRVLAFQTLYAYEVGCVPLEQLLQFSWACKDDAAHAEREEFVFARLLVHGVMEHLPEIDASIKKYLAANWNFDRISKVSLSILRMSAYSILYQPDISVLIIIDEAIHIAKEYGGDDSFRFVNAVLDRIYKAARHDEA